MKNTSNSIENSEKKSRKTNIVPDKQAIVLAVAESVAKKWMTTNEVKLQWMKADDFHNLVQAFKISLEQRIHAGNSRQSKTKLFQNLDNKLNEVVEELKIAILGKFGKTDGKFYYSEFGIVKKNRAYKLPKERGKRQQSLYLLMKGLEKYQLQVAKYSLDDFSSMQTEYNTLMAETQDIDSTIAAEIGNKNELMKKVEKVLNALIWVIKGNYPDTYHSILRAWGFQKEKY